MYQIGTQLIAPREPGRRSQLQARVIVVLRSSSADRSESLRGLVCDSAKSFVSGKVMRFRRSQFIANPALFVPQRIEKCGRKQKR